MKPLLPLRTLVMIVLSIMLVLGAVTVAAPPPSTPPSSGEVVLEYEASVRKLFDEVLSDVIGFRGIPPPDGVEVKIVSIEWFREEERRKVAEESQTISLKEIVYRALLIVSEDYSVGEARVKRAGAILSAVSGRRLYIVKEYFRPEVVGSAKRTLAHEITHILQGGFKPPPLRTDDQRRAWSALIEGDADFTADTYIGPPPSRREAKTPLDRLAGFPYTYGKVFIEALYRADGWLGVNSAYRKPPKTTEEILHPEAYLSGGSYREVAALAPPSSGWEAVWTNTFGEYFIRVMLQDGVAEEEATSAAAGWGGDNVTLYRRADMYAVGWNVSWDSEAEASEFYGTYVKMLRSLGGVEVEPGLYLVRGYYVKVAVDGVSTTILSSKERALIDALRPGG